MRMHKGFSVLAFFAVAIDVLCFGTPEDVKDSHNWDVIKLQNTSSNFDSEITNRNELSDDLSNPPTNETLSQLRSHVCHLVDWREQTDEIERVGQMLKFMASTPMVRDLRERFDKIELNTTIPDFVTKKILGVSYRISAVLGSLKLVGVKDVRLEPVQVLAPSKIRGRINTEDLTVILAVNLTYAKQDGKFLGWTPFCPYELKFWKKCPSHDVEVVITQDVSKMIMVTDLDIQLYKCAGGFLNSVVCRIKSGWSFVKSFFTNSWTFELLSRISHLHLDNVALEMQDYRVRAEIKRNPDTLSPEFEDDAKSIGLMFADSQFTRNLVKRTLASIVKRAGNTAIETIKPHMKSKCSRRRR